jgi:enoyl-CoA hydratase/carnithine racemase
MPYQPRQHPEAPAVGRPVRRSRDVDEEMRESLKSADFKKGVAHFLEKRPARFSGN